MNEAGADLGALIGPVARRLLGEPNKQLSSRDEMRFGSHGSVAVCIGGAKRGTWYDHENQVGGGVLDLLRVRLNLVNGSAMEWIRSEMKISIPSVGGMPIVASYDYFDESGVLLYQVVRLEPKTFRQRRPAPDGRGWVWKMTGVRRVPYRLPDLLASSDTVFIVEGEKDCDRLAALGLTATTNPAGAGKWPAEFAPHFQGRHVVVLPDNDDAGHQHAGQVSANLRQIAASVRIIALPDLPPKADVSDWLGAGGTVAHLREIADQTQFPGLDDQEPLEGMPAPPGEPPDPPTWDDGGPPEDGDDRPIIKIVQGEIDTIASAVERALKETGLPIYQRGDVLVRPASRQVQDSGGGNITVAGLVEMTLPRMHDAASRAARFLKFDGRRKKWINSDPPEKSLAVLLGRAGEWDLPPIAGVITTPTLRPDGSLLDQPGFDTATRLYHVCDPGLRVTVPPSPTRADAQRALDLLVSLLEEFPFISAADRAIALSGIITPVVRGAMDVSPLHAYRAPSAGSGKSYMVDLAAAICTGRRCPVMTPSAREEEMEKRLTGMLLAGLPIVSIDNLNGELGGDLICQAVERPLIQLRPLGTSDLREIENRVTLYATGNGLRVRGDMTRRTLVCTLDPAMERPETRQFQHRPLDLIRADRGAYVAACLTIARSYLIDRGAERPDPMASFESWSNTVRGALIWLGCDDPLLTIEAAREEDPELMALQQFMSGWREAFGTDRDMTVPQMIEAAEERSFAFGDGDQPAHPSFRTGVLEIAGDRGKINSRILGKWLGARGGRVSGGLKLVRGRNGHGGYPRWSVRAA